MAISPGRVQYGKCKLRVSNATLTGGRTIEIGISAAPVYGDAHTSGATLAMTVLSIVTDGSLPPANPTIVAVALVEDGTDVAGRYVVAGALQTGVLAYFERTGSTLVVGDTYTMGNGGALNPAIVKAGTMRAVLIFGNQTSDAQDINSVDTGAASAEYHYDTDFNSARGALAPTQPSAHSETTYVDGWCGKRAEVSVNPVWPGNRGYTGAVTITVELDPAGNAAGDLFINAKEVKTAWSLNTDGTTRPKGVVRLTPDTDGTVLTLAPLNVDTAWPQFATGYYFQMAVNAELGDATTPAGEKPALETVIAASTIDATAQGLTDTQLSWLLFAPSGHATDITAVSASRIRSTATQLTAAHHVAIRSIVRLATATAAAGATLYNRGEAVSIDLRFDDAFGTEIDPDNTVVRSHDNAHTVEATTAADSAAPYNIGYTTGAGAVATFDTVGSPRHPHVTFAHYASLNPTFDYDGVDEALATMFSLSSKYLMDQTAIAASADNDRTVNNVGGVALRNRGEVHSFNYFLGYARGVPLVSIASTISQTIETPAGTDENVQATESTDATGKVDSSYTIATTDAAAFDTVGLAKRILITRLGNTTDQSLDAWFVSSKYLMDQTQVAAPADNDRIVNNVGGISVRNRGETHSFNYFLGYARGAPLASIVSTISQTIETPAGVDENVQTTESTDATGKVDSTYVVAVGDAAAATLAGLAKRILISRLGNTTDQSLDAWFVSSLLLVNDVFTGKTDTQDANGVPTGTEGLQFFVGADVLYFKAQILNVRSTVYTPANIPVTATRLRGVTIEETETAAVVASTSPNGWQDLFYVFDVVAPAGARTIRVVGTINGNTTGNVDTAVVYSPSYTGNLGGTYGVETHREDGARSVRITCTPLVATVADALQKISESAPVPALDVAPLVTLHQHGAAGADTLVQAQTAMVAINGAGATENDDWQYTYAALADGEYTATVIFTLGGGQVMRSVLFKVGSGPAFSHESFLRQTG